MKKRIIFLTSLFSMVSVIALSQDADITAYVSAYRELAIREEQRTGVPASITLAQGILESEAGTSELVRRSNNHFGIKCKDYWKGERVYHDDDLQGECFRKYASAEDSYRDHSDFLRGSTRYESLFKLDPEDYKSWAWGLKKAGYATNPKYSQQIIKYIEDYDLQSYTLVALGKKQLPADNALVARNSRKNGNAGLNPSESGNGNPVTRSEAANQGAEDMNNGPNGTGSGTLKSSSPLNYPEGEFRINDTKVTYARKGTSLLAISEQFDIRLKHLIDFNDLDENLNVLREDQLIYLQRKRKHGGNEYHIVEEGENLYGIAQKEGIRLNSLMKYNLLEPGMEPAPGENLNLKSTVDNRPVLVSERPPKRELMVAKENTPLMQRHIVQSRETLYSIAKKYEVRQEQIREWNRLQSDDLRIGQELVIYKSQ